MIDNKKRNEPMSKDLTTAAPMPDFIKEHSLVQQENVITKMPKDSLAQLAVAVERMVILKELHGNNKDKNALVWSEYTKYEKIASDVLEENKLGEFVGATHKIKIDVKQSVKTPKTDTDKKALFDWIEAHKGGDVLFAYQTISSQSLNKFYKEEENLHFELTGETSFTMDGVEMGSSVQKLK